MNSEKISIIVPVYNVENFLNECVESLRNQTYSNIEIILVDDGSPDNCPCMCDEYAKIDSRIKVIHQSNGGVSVARNAGIEAATGEYIAFVDSDDFVEINYLEVLYNNLKGCDMSECGLAMLYDDRVEKIRENDMPKILSWKEYLTETNLNGFLSYAIVWAKLFKRTLFKGVRFPVGRINGEDESTTYKLVYNAKRVSRVYDNLYNYRQRESGASHNEISEKRLDDCESFFDERIEFFKDKNELDLVAFFSAKKAIKLVWFLKNTTELELKKYCYQAAMKAYGDVKSNKSVPFKYRAYIRLFLFLNARYK